MNIRTEKEEKIQCDILVIGVFEKETNSHTKMIDDALNNEFSNSVKRKEFSGEANQLKMISTLGKLPAQKVLIVGLGKKEEYKLETLRRAAASAIKVAIASSAKKVVTALHEPATDHASEEQRIATLVEGSLLGSYQFNQLKTQNKDKEKQVDELVIVTKANADKIIKKSEILCNSISRVRDMVNLPGNLVTPTWLADEAVKLRKLGVKVTVYGKSDLHKMGFNALLSVAQGSVQEPKFVVMEYKSSIKLKETYAFVGKGITFDSGGLNIKPAKGMEDMKMDKAGAATVIGLMEAIAKLKMPLNVVCAFPTCENMPSGTAYRPGDVIIGYNKKSIEMMNTDAEGRMVLSDALSYVEKEYTPTAMIDIATLTGACIVALGYWATGLFTKDDKLAEELTAAGNDTHERVWRLPLWDDYKDNMKSDIADVRSIGRGYDAGAIEGATFLSHFVDKVSWAHLDIAGTAWSNDGKHYFTKGGTGNGIRLLVRWLEMKMM